MMKNGVQLQKIIKVLAVVFAIGYIFSFSQVQAATTIGANITTGGYLKLNTSATPAGVNGTIHFDGTKFRCYQEGAWSDCIGGISGTVLVNQGGTNITSYTAGDLVYATGATTLSKLGVAGHSNGDILTLSGGLPTWTNANPLVLTNTYVHDTLNGANPCTSESLALVGDVCIATVDNKTYILQYSPYTTASNWKELIADKSQYLLKASNLSDVASVATSRTNLGLGTGDSPTFNGLNLNTGALISGAGALTLDSAAALNFGNTNATSISFGRTGIDVTVNGDFNIADYIDFNTIIPPATNRGRLFYDSVQESMSYYTDIPGLEVNIGQRTLIRVKNETGSPISADSIVYINGATDTGIPTVDLAQADSTITAKALGMASKTIASGAEGFITTFGMIYDQNTSTYSAGDPIYLSPTTPGAFQTARPTGYYEVPIGFIGKSDATTGTILLYMGTKVGTAVAQGEISFGNASGYLIGDGTNLFWDNTNKRLGIGDNTPDYTLDVAGDIKAGNGSVFTLGYISNPDPSPNSNPLLGPLVEKGAMYYNTSTNKFRCLEDITWKDCVTSAAIVADTLDFIDFDDAMELDADTSIDLSTFDLTTNGTGNYLVSNTGTVGLTPTLALTLTAGAASTWSTTAGDLTINSGPASVLTLDSGTTGAVNIGNSANVKTITIGNTTGATSLVLSSGSAGISLTTSGGANLMPYGLAAGNTTNQRFLELAVNGTDYVGFKAPDSITANKIWTLPSADGSSGQFLSTDGLGVLSWSTAAGGGGTLQSAYDNGATITTAGPVDIAFTLTSGDFTASGAGAVKLSPAGGVSLSPYGTNVGNTTEQRFLELAANGTNYVGFKAPDNINDISGSKIWTLPGIDGSNGQVLTTDGSGLLSWSTASGVGSAALSAITAATGYNSISNVDNAQAWNWSLTTPAKTAFSFNENVASINGAGSQYILSVETLDTSTAAPLKVTAMGNTIINTTSAGGVTIGNSTAAQPVTIDAGTAALSFGNSNSTKTINIGTGTSVDTINIGNGATGADLITIGSANAGASSFASGAALTLTGGAASVWSTTAGNLTLQAGSGTVSLGTSTNLTANGALAITSGTATALTINSGTTGDLLIGTDASPETINIGTGTAVKTLTLGSSTTTSTTNIQSGTGGINLKAEDTAEGNIQIGTGGVGTDTPDLLLLDVKSSTGNPATVIEGAMYYNTIDNKFRCYEGAGWKDCDTAGVVALDDAYNNGNTITVDGSAVTLTVPDGSNNQALIINQDDLSNDPVALVLNNKGTGNFITATDGGVIPTTIWYITNNGIINTSGNINATGTGAITSAGTLTALNGLTMSTGALSLTSTSGSISSTGLTGLTLTLASGTGAITAPTLNLNTTGTGATSIGNGTGAVSLTLASGLDATGDIYYRNSSGNLTRLGVGSNTNVLTLAGGLPTWAAPVAAAHALTDTNNTVSGLTAGRILRATDATTYGFSTATYPNTATQGDLLIATGANTIGSLADVEAGRVLISGGAGDPTYSATPTLGVNGVTLGTLSLSGNLSGTILIQPQAAAGTYNFNLPTTAGTSGQVLTSAGGAGAPMTWTTASGSMPAGTTNNSTLRYNSGTSLWVENTSVLITTAGTISGSGALTLNSNTTNALTLDSGTTGEINLGTGNNAKTINIGTGTAGNAINIGTNNTTADIITIGSQLDTIQFNGYVRKTLTDNITATLQANCVTVASRYVLTSDINIITVSANNADCVALPEPVAGMEISVMNTDAGQNVTVYPPTGSTINGGASVLATRFVHMHCFATSSTTWICYN